MGNTFKKFFGNKNTVTILGIILGIGVLVFSYSYRVNKAIQPLRVPYAKVEIGSATEITAEMIGTIDVPSSFTSKATNLVTDSSQIIGKRVAIGTTIPRNGLFFQDQVITTEELPDAAFANIPDGYTIYALPVNIKSSYYNSIYPGNYIDLYLNASDDNNRPIFGKLISSIEVLDVKDDRGNHVFENGDSLGDPSVFLFVVPDEMYLFLKKAELLRYEIIPIPRNASYSANPGDTEYSSEYLKSLILSKTAVIPDEE